LASIEYVVNAVDSASSTFGKIAASADRLSAQMDELSRKQATPSVELQDQKFQVTQLKVQALLQDLNDRVANPKAELQDKQFKFEMADAQVKLDRLNAKVAKPKVSLEGLHSAELGILKLNAMIDRLDGRRAEVTVDVNVNRSALSRLRGLFPGGRGGAGGILRGLGGTAGAAGGAAQGIGGLLSALGPYGQAALYGTGGTLGAALLPALLPALLGGGVGLGAAGGAFALGHQAEKQLVALNKSLASAKGAQKKDIEAQIKALQKVSGPELAIFGAFQDVGHTAMGAFAGALQSRGAGFSAGPGGQVGAPSFLTSLTGILKQLQGFIKSIGPGLGDLFRASVPFLQMFVTLLERAAKTLLPVFTQSLRQFQPFLPLIATGLLRVVKGFAGLLNALGPRGMEDATKIFVTATKVIEFALVATGKVMNALAVGIVVGVHDIAKWWDWMRHHTATVFDGIRHEIAHVWDQIFENSIGVVIRFGHDIERDWNDFRHRTAVVFDGVRHDIAHIWDMIWNNTIGRIERGLHDVAHDWDVLRHNTSSVFDTIRHAIASAWDTIWNNTIGRVQRGIHDVENWYNSLPRSVRNILSGFGNMLKGIATGSMNDFWNGLKKVAGQVWHWLTGWITALPGFIKRLLHMSPPHPGSVFFDLGVQLMEHLGAGIRHAAASAADAAWRTITHLVHLPAGIPVGPHAISGAVGLGRAMAAQRGWTGTQWDALYQLWQRESGWNRLARNPSSGAYGIPQALPPSKMGPAANPPTSSAAAQIAWGLGYIASVYGNPVAAYSKWLSRSPHWYGSGLQDGIFDRPTIIGVGERGPERVDVTPLGSPRSGGQPQKIVWEVRAANDTATERYIVGLIQKHVIVHGGDVQTALGQPA
jgi:hypothetical protein